MVKYGKKASPASSKIQYNYDVGFNLFFGLMIILGFRALSNGYSNSNQVDNGTTEIAVEHKKFINKLAPQAQRLQGDYNILPSITLAQAILESDWGTSKLASKYHNLFGVKAQSGQTQSVYLDTQEFVNGRYVTVKARFEVYDNWNDSLADHARLLAYGTKWNSSQYQDVINASNYLQAADGLQRDGYATDPTYTEKLVSIIKKYKLYQYDD
ncbi:glycoside hydrolase family 73 protein [Lentilactobacillus kisonensis]|uniref:glycoside hydrolase family 73 protein n=1 Tax=Lentilactobacillus kisonensis TaxID=481722 RepID=UPI000AFC1C68|nr:glycoside hydrolase family 73 protein [Lentilactobacillus kisonensis]